MNLSDEIRKQIEKNKALKLSVGEINNHLSILENLVRKDIMEQVDEAYQKGFEDGKEYGLDESDMREAVSYQRGLEDGKAVNDKGCEGCKYSGTPQGDSPCFNCSNYYQNNWTAKDDKIEVGDVVMIKQFKHPENHLFVVTKVSDQSVWGVEGDGSWNYWAINEVIKTDKHFDIDKILEEMRNDN